MSLISLSYGFTPDQYADESVRNAVLNDALAEINAPEGVEVDQEVRFYAPDPVTLDLVRVETFDEAETIIVVLTLDA